MTRLQRAYLRLVRAKAREFEAKRDVLAARQTIQQLKRKRVRKC